MKRTVFCAALLLAAGCSSPKKNRTVDPLRVETIVAAPSADVGAAVYVGAIEEESSAALSFPVAGTVARTFADEGRRVGKGHLLAELDPTSARRTFEAAEAALNQAKDACARLKQLYDAESLPEIKWVEAQTRLRQAEAAFGIAKKNLEDCSLYAPFSGVVGQRRISAGETALPGVPVLALTASATKLVAEDIMRHLRFQYPTFMLSTPQFEIDEEGQPWWIAPRVIKTIGLFGGTDNHGAVLVNAITGESEYYEEPPAWVDHVYSAELIIEQYDYYGQYHNGFWNSIFGQRDVTVTTDGYNYLAEGDDVYLYTGVTSVGGDESNIGFLLSNQRTKETKYYPCAGATEYSAMDSAEGQVQNLRYNATFPLLLNIAEQPTYFMALKDASELVKMYAMVNVNQYQIVAIGATVADCEANYRQMLLKNNLISDDQGSIDVTPSDYKSIEGTIAEIRTAVVDGNSIYFLRFDGESAFSVRMSAAEVAYAPLLNVGDRVCVYYRDGYVTENWIEASDVELLDGSAQSAPPVETSVSTEDSADPVENAQEMP